MPIYILAKSENDLFIKCYTIYIYSKNTSDPKHITCWGGLYSVLFFFASPQQKTPFYKYYVVIFYMDVIILVIFLCWLVLGFFISRKDTRQGIIPTAMTDIPIFVLVVIWFVVFGLSYSFYVFFTVLILLYLFFDCIQKLLNKKYNQTIGTGDIKLYLLTFCLFPFSFTFGFLWNPFISTFVLSLVFLVSMIFVKLIYVTFLDRLPKPLQVIGTNAISTSIRFAPVIYISSIITFFVYII